MEILQRLGIPFEALASERLRSQAAALTGASSKQSVPGTVIDPSDADDFFGKLLVPAVMGSEPLAGLVEGDECLLGRFETMCRAYARRSPSSEYWQGEADVWGLLREVLPPLAPSGPQTDLPGTMSPRALVQSRIESSPLLQHVLRVKSWLEATAGPFVPAESRQAPVPLTLDTLAPVDPDSRAPRDELDAAWEEAHLLSLWSHVRRGQMQEAIAACFAVGQPWRAGILSGGFLASDEEPAVSGNPARDLWASTLTQLLLAPGLSVPERALYGALVGDLAAMQPLCRTWQDVLWAALVALLERFVQQTLSGSCPEEAALSGHLLSALTAVEQRFPALGQDPLFAAVRALVLRQDWSQSVFPHLARGGEPFARLAAIAAILLAHWSPATPMQSAYYDVLLHGYLVRLLDTEQTRHWLFYAAQVRGDELRTDALVAFWAHLATRPRDVKWLRLKEARFHGLPLAPSLTRCIAQALDEQPTHLFEFLSFPEDPDLTPVLAEYAAFVLRRHLLRSDWAAARSLLTDLPMASLAATAALDSGAQEDSAPFVKELVYYGHLLQVISAYETWSSTYTTALTGAELPAYQAASAAFAQEALRLLTADWLGDVEAVLEPCFGTGAEREDQLLRLRALHLSDLALLLLALIASEPAPGLSPILLSLILSGLGEPSLELWLDFHRARRLSAVVERLQRLRLQGEPETVRQATLAFLQDAMRSL